MAKRLNPAGPTPETRSPKYHRGLRISEPASYRLPTSLLSHKQPNRVCYNLPAPSARRIFEAGSYTLLEIPEAVPTSPLLQLTQTYHACNLSPQPEIFLTISTPVKPKPRTLSALHLPERPFSFQHPLGFPKRGGFPNLGSLE